MNSFFGRASAGLYNATRVILVVALALMTLALRGTHADADTGDAATGAGSIRGTYSFTFSATGTAGFAATGTMTYFIPNFFNATASVRCLLVSGNEAVLVGTVTSSTSSNYVGTQMIFVVADNATPGINADQWDFDFAGTEESCDTYANRFPIVGGVIDAGEITVVNPIDQAIGELTADLQASAAGPGASYLSKLNAAASSLAAGKTAAACNQLAALTHEIEAQRGKTLTDAQTDLLLQRVAALMFRAGCT